MRIFDAAKSPHESLVTQTLMSAAQTIIEIAATAAFSAVRRHRGSLAQAAGCGQVAVVAFLAALGGERMRDDSARPPGRSFWADQPIGMSRRCWGSIVRCKC